MLKGTLDYPLTHGDALINDLQKWGGPHQGRGHPTTLGVFPGAQLHGNGHVLHLGAHRPVPDDGEAGSAVAELVAAAAERRLGLPHTCSRASRIGTSAISKSCAAGRPISKRGTRRPWATIVRGNAVSPWSGDPVPGDYIKEVAQRDGMGAQLFALCVNRGDGRDFRLPTSEDVDAPERARTALAERWDDWLAAGLIPTEPFPLDTNDQRPNTYGMDRWYKLFAPRSSSPC